MSVSPGDYLSPLLMPSYCRHPDNDSYSGQAGESNSVRSEHSEKIHLEASPNFEFKVTTK
jgi:hypothetical protein